MLPFTRKILEDWAGPQVLQEALRMLDSGRVLRVEYKAGEVGGMIQASPRPIRSGLRINDKEGFPDNLCPCRDARERGVMCAHAIALCLDLLRIEASPERKEKLEQERRRATRLSSFREDQYLKRVRPGAAGSVPATLRLELPCDWPERLRTGARIPLRVMIESRGRSGPVSAIRSDVPLGMDHQDDNLLFVLEDICEGPVRDVVEIGAQELINLLNLHAGRPLRVEGAVAAVPVDAEKVATILRLDLDPRTGELVLQVKCPGDPPGTPQAVFIVGRRTGWMFDGACFRPLASVMPEPLHPLYRMPTVIERKSVPRFIKHELPTLQGLVGVETDLSAELFTLTPDTPDFRLLVRGSPASLSAILYARYGELELIAGKPAAESDFATPDPHDLMSYRVRNLKAEQAALSRLDPAGFGGPVGDQMAAITHKPKLLAFLASHMPALRRAGWKVDLQGRVVEYMDTLESATPVVRVDGAGVTGAGQGGAGWFDVSFNFEAADGESLSPADIQRALRMGESHVERNGRVILFDSDAVESMNGVFRDCSTGEGGRAGAFRMSGVHAAYVKSSIYGLDGVDIEAPPAWLDAAERQNRDAKLEPVDLPPGLNATLRAYQHHGISWLRFLENNGFSGILADEMGLGKTLQTLAWLLMERSAPAAQGKPVLIICPTSLVGNWIEEGKKFAPSLTFVDLTGSDRKERQAKAAEFQVWVTSYAVLRIDLDYYRQTEFGVVVLDEAQNIKNRSTQNAQAVKTLRSVNRLVLTGTPIENSVSDLWSIMDFLMPGYLGPHEAFRGSYELAIQAGGPGAEDAQKRLKKKLNPFFLRRLKRDVAKDLPPKIEKVAMVDLTRDQKLVYAELLKASQRKINDMVEAQGFNRTRMEVLKTLLRLRQACCHLSLLKLKGVESEAPSAKLDYLMEMLFEARSGGNRVLVFSQFTSMLDLIRTELDRQSFRYCHLDGSTKDRMSVVRQFNAEPDITVFLISLKAGGTGLNLTGADMVIHFDPWWNPAVEDQATDRAYRIGQKRTVYAQKLIARDTVEEKVLALQRKKKAVIDATLETDEQVIEKLSWDDVRDLLSL